MGLAQKKIRSKLSRDPNNTNWSQNTSRFGHKVLISQGWTPGSTLGVPDSKYADSHYTAASASHVRVTIKDDNLGLGARTGRPDRNETFGLELLSGLLGRLNGKEETVLKKEEAARRNVKLMTYHQNRWGASRFVFGGYLVGDEIQEALEVLEQNPQIVSKENKKKRKRSEKRQEEEELQREESVLESTDEEEEEAETEEQAKKRKKEEKRKRKEEKKARKEAKRLKQEKKMAAVEDETIIASSSSDQDVNQSAHERMAKSNITSSVTSGSSTPLVMTPRGRQAIRQRYIQQKRMAVLDDKALKEIFMIKRPQ